MDVWRGEEGEKYESLLSNERSRGIKFEIELKCLRKETGKLDVSLKSFALFGWPMHNLFSFVLH